jgi:Arc/MetJ family transcription regulator
MNLCGFAWRHPRAHCAGDRMSPLTPSDPRAIRLTPHPSPRRKANKPPISSGGLFLRAGAWGCHRRPVMANDRQLSGGIERSIIRCYLSCLREDPMRTTLALDDELLSRAQALTGMQEKSALVREGLKALIERESARRLARLGGTQPRLKAPPRRRAQSA